MLIQDKLKYENDEEGYELWLRYKQIADDALLMSYRALTEHVTVIGDSPTTKAILQELDLALPALLGSSVEISDEFSPQTSFLICRTALLPADAGVTMPNPSKLGDAGFAIVSGESLVVVTANTDIGLLYGMFQVLRHLQTHQPANSIDTVSVPKIKLRMLNHWDNLDGTIERGYAGYSLWDWHKLPHYVEPRYTDYARATASIGINAVSLTNVNANALILTEQYLHKVAAIAAVFRPYGIKVFLTARFSAPIEIGDLETADPLDSDVIVWWQKKARAIYEIMPDFGGFVVKANSEGQPGPHDYGRSHAEGANLLADAIKPYGGLVIWRAFVYSHMNDEDRAKQANLQLVPLDGTFHENVLLQVKNGPIDFQPREPFHPLFGAMPKTPLMIEFQLTQEYLGCGTHLVYLAPLFAETLFTDTYCKGEGSTVAKVIDGSLDGHATSGMASVSNIGDERNWCGHPFGAANWYAYGRMAWDYTLSPEALAEQWLCMTFSNDPIFLQKSIEIMMQSREAVVDYMMPLGLHHIFAWDHHYGPGPWIDTGRPDWTAVYYHQADNDGIGFDRTLSGSNALAQYHPPYRCQMENLETCPDELLLYFHHVPWNYMTKSGRTLWQELCYRYNRGVDTVDEMQAIWSTLADFVDHARFTHVQSLLSIQQREARWWRDACLLYFQTFSRQPIPEQYEQPAETLEHYMKIEHYFVPGIPERRF
jgi:alpha-glucuronidase